MVLFDNDGEAGAPYSWRNSLKDTSAYTGGWYKVTGLATIETKDHEYDAETHLCTNQISVSRGTYEDCGAEEPEVSHPDGWEKDENGIWHYYENNAAATGWKQVSGTWYLFNDEGDMLIGWQKVGSTWYYLKDSGAMATGWVKDGNSWYFLKDSGAMATGWVKDGNSWYFLKDSGAMATGWVKDGSTWYFLKSSGAMAASEWCKGYWLNANGSWTYQPKGSWKKDSTGWWFGDTSGWYAKNTTTVIDGVSYSFNANGYLQ